MKAATLAEIRRELSNMENAHIAEVCLRMARYKKENKELLTYLLYESSDEQAYISAIKEEVDEDFEVMNTSQAYYAKKTIRKILRNLTKYVRFSGSKQTEVELLLYFCIKMRDTRLVLHPGTVIGNILQRQIAKIKKSLSSLHEDLQADYQLELDEVDV